MNAHLEELDSTISEGKERLKTLRVEASNVSERLEVARNAEAAAIVSGQSNISKLRKDVIELQAAIVGTQRAWGLQSAILEELEREKRRELRKMGEAQEPELRAEVNKMAADLYGLLAGAIAKTMDLRAKVRELRAALKMQGPSVEQKAKQLEFLCNALEDSLGQSLSSHFPVAIFATGELPSVESLKKSLRKGSLR
jgi:chromosome segregation ATPase